MAGTSCCRHDFSLHGKEAGKSSDAIPIFYFLFAPLRLQKSLFLSRREMERRRLDTCVCGRYFQVNAGRGQICAAEVAVGRSEHADGKNSETKKSRSSAQRTRSSSESSSEKSEQTAGSMSWKMCFGRVPSPFVLGSESGS